MGGVVYHVLNRANARSEIFATHNDYAAFEGILDAACQRFSMRLLCYCLMPNHWHLVIWPRQDDDMPAFMGWLTMTHAQRWHAFHETIGHGHLYQGRYKSFPVQDDGHLHILARYVEGNPLRAGLVSRAEDWRWSSLWHRMEGNLKSPPLSEWPIECPDDWLEQVNDQRIPECAEEAFRASIQRGRPFGSQTWTERIAATLGLESSLRPRGRPWPAKTIPS